MMNELGNEDARPVGTGAGLFARPEITQVSDWTAAELNAARWMRFWGWPDAEVTSAGPDAGIDVRAHSAIAQVKHEARQVGRPVLHRLVGARARDRDDIALLFFTGAGYSRAAVEYANERDIALFHYHLDGTMQALNGAAESVLYNAPTLNQAVAMATASQDIKDMYARELETLRTVLAAVPKTSLFSDCRLNDYGTRAASYIAVVNDPIVTLIGIGYGPHPPTHPLRVTDVFGLHSFATHDPDVTDTYGMAVGPPLHLRPAIVWDHVEVHIRNFARKYLRDKALADGSSM